MLNNTRWFWTIPLLFAVVCTPGCSKQAKRERHLKRANSYFDKKEYKKAEVEYLHVLRLQPTNMWVAARLANIHFDNGNFTRALPFLMRVAEVDKSNVDVRMKLANLYLAGGQLPKAREAALYVLERDPQNDEAIVLLSETALTAKEITESNQRLQKLQPQAGNKAAWHVAAAGLHLRQTNMQAAENAFRKALELEPSSSRVHVVLGNYWWQKGDIQKADEHFRKAADLAPLNSPVRLRRVEFKFATGSTNEGKELLQQMNQQAPDYVPAWIYRARIAFGQQDFLECSNIVHRVLVQDGANYDARLLRANLKSLQGKRQDVIKDLEDSKRLYPGSSEIAFQLAVAHLRNQERQKAIQSAQEAVTLNPNSVQAILLLAELNIEKGDAASAIIPLENLIKKHPGLSRAYFLLASAYRAQQRFDDAILLYNSLGKSFPTNAAVPFLTGLTLRQQNRNVDARKAFQKASELAPDDLMVIYQLVDLDIQEKRYPEGLQRAKSLLEKDPRSAGAKFLEARILTAQTNLVEAEAALQKTLELDSNFGPAYGLLAQIYLGSRKLAEALKNLEQMAVRNPRNVATIMLMGSIYEQMGEADKAVVKYREVLKLAPQFIPALNNLAYVLSEKFNKVDEAYEHAAKARELAPENTHVADTLGWILYRRRDYARALILLQESVAKSPEQAEIQYHVGMAYYAMAQEGPAQTALKRAIELNPNLPGSADARDRLSVLEMDLNKADPMILAKLEERIGKQPDDMLALVRLSKMYARLGKTDKAIQACENARKLNPANVPVLVQLAELYSKNGKDPKQALALTREARKLAPNDPSIAHILGRLAYQARDHTWACSLLQESAAKQSGNAELLLDLAHAYYSVARIDEAEQTAKRILQADAGSSAQKDAQWFLTLIELYKGAKDRLPAEVQVQQSLKAQPDYLPALMVSGLIHEQRGRTNEARQTYEQVVTQNPEFSPAKKQLAGLYTDHFGDQKKAFDHAAKARETMKQDPELAKILGKITYRSQDYTNAVRFLRESALKLPDDPELLYFLGMAHYQLKEKTQSKQALGRALALNPNAPVAPEARRLLAQLDK